MANAATVIATGCLVAVLFDVLGATAARWLKFRYASLAPGSFAIYTATALIAARLGPAWAGLLAGATVAFIEATLGWALSWWIGPGRPPTNVLLSQSRIIRIVVNVTMIGACFGGVGTTAAILWR